MRLQLAERRDAAESNRRWREYFERGAFRTGAFPLSTVCIVDNSSASIERAALDFISHSTPVHDSLNKWITDHNMPISATVNRNITAIGTIYWALAGREAHYSIMRCLRRYWPYLSSTLTNRAHETHLDLTGQEPENYELKTHGRLGQAHGAVDDLIAQGLGVLGSIRTQGGTLLGTKGRVEGIAQTVRPEQRTN